MSGVKKSLLLNKANVKQGTDLLPTSENVLIYNKDPVSGFNLFPTKLPFEVTTKYMLRRLIDTQHQINRDFTNLLRNRAK